ncbi:MAG: hypothetical protein H6Q67_750 [Firmicutes bacterium]|nr:hypothetical protein [Bacillota bacterium]
MPISVISGSILWIVLAAISYTFSSPSIGENKRGPLQKISRSKRSRAAYALIMATFILGGLVACNSINL